MIQTRNHTLIFDTGAKVGSSFDAGEQVVLPFLRSKGVKKIDHLVISHLDNDHSGGAVSILNSLPVSKIIMNELSFSQLQGVSFCERGLRWEWDNVYFEFLHPTLDTKGKKNDRSCVLQIEASGKHFILAADIEAKTEKELLKNFSNHLQSDVLLVPHHGSNTSSTQSFIDTVNPSVALISAGYRNRYHHPHPLVLKRYQDKRIPLLNTAEEGALSFELGTDRIDIKRYRYEHRRIYRPYTNMLAN